MPKTGLASEIKMVTMQIKKLIEDMSSIDKKVELKRVIEEAEKAGISRGFANDAIGRLASEKIGTDH